MNLIKSLSLFLVVCSLWSCRAAQNSKQKIAEQLLSSVKDLYVPDSRTGIFEIKPIVKGNRILLNGITTSRQGKQEAATLFRHKGWKVTDSIRLIPDTTCGKSIYGVVNQSVVPMNTNPRYGAEMSTQGLLGMPVRILENDSWLRIQTPDNYIAWTLSGYIQPMDRNEYNNWITAPKVIFLSHYGNAYSQPDVLSEPVSDLISGCMLRLEGVEGNFYKVAYPDGRVGYILQKDAKPIEEWQKGIELTAESLIRTAHSLNGVPYLWGGMSAKGLDCSGFIKTITFLHGLILQRDASQQAYTGKPVDITNGYDNLQPGDLLFFGEKNAEDKKEHIFHVGLYLGNLNFIHCISNVHTGSLNPASPLYDKYNADRLVRATRILGSIGSEGISTIQTNPFYQLQK